MERIFYLSNCIFNGNSNHATNNLWDRKIIIIINRPLLLKKLAQYTLKKKNKIVWYIFFKGFLVLIQLVFSYFFLILYWYRYRKDETSLLFYTNWALNSKLDNDFAIEIFQVNFPVNSKQVSSCLQRFSTKLRIIKRTKDEPAPTKYL